MPNLITKLNTKSTKLNPAFFILFSVFTLTLSFLALSLTLTSSTSAAPATFTVTNTNDIGAGSLRQAIEDANTNNNPTDQDIVNFNIPGTGDHTIAPQSQLTINQSLMVDGYSQDDARENTLPAPDRLDGLLRIEISLINASGPIDIRSNDVTLKGLVINRATDGILNIENSDNFKLLGSYIDMNMSGLTSGRNIGLYKSIKILNSDNVNIGGDNPSDRNVIGFCGDVCIFASGEAGETTEGLVIRGNNIAIAADSVSHAVIESFGQLTIIGGTGIVLKAGVSNVQIGGEAAGQGNTIDRNFAGAVLAEDVDDLYFYGNRVFFGNQNEQYPVNDTGGLFLAGVINARIGSNTQGGRNLFGGMIDSFSLRVGDSRDTNRASENIQISNNHFGVMDDGRASFSSTGDGIFIDGSSNFVGIRNNKIANALQGRQGVVVSGMAQNVSILQNSIYNNSGLGIDLGNNNVTLNDSMDADSGPNTMLNTPVISKVTESGGDTEVSFGLDVPAGNYRIEFFSNTEPDPSGSGEGETYLGYKDITSSGNGVEEINHTLTGTSHSNLATTATLIDPNSPTGFGPTSEFGSEGSIPVPSDIEISKKLLNPEDVQLNGILNYEVSFTNHGPGEVDLVYWNGSQLGENNLFQDLLPPQLTYVGVSSPNNDVSCNYFGDGSAAFFGPSLANHTDYGGTFCQYTGASQTLPAGQTFKATLSARVKDDSSLEFINYITSPPGTQDPDYTNYANSAQSGEDLLDDLVGNTSNNNFGYAYSQVADTETTKTLTTDPADIKDGSTLEYAIEYTNNGPSSIDPRQFDGSGQNPLATGLVIDFLPPNLSYVSQSNPDLSCTWVNQPQDLAALRQYIIPAHQDYTAMFCAYTGSDSELTAGESISTTITTQVGTVGDGFTNYAFGNSTIADSDTRVIGNSNKPGSGEDFIDNLKKYNPNNFTQSVYQVEQEQGGSENGGQNGGSQNPTGGSSSNGSNPNRTGSSASSNSGSGLSSTGQNILLVLVLAISLIGGAGYLQIKKKKNIQ
jgi:hypothetical protein